MINNAKTGWEILPIETRKDKIKNPPASEIHAIPRLGASVLMVGSSGSGKSTLLVSLLSETRFFMGAFDETIIVSPTCFSDDVQQALDLDPDNCIDDISQAPGIIGDLMSEQRDLIETKGAHKAPQVCLLYDDIIGDRDLLKSPEFVKSFIASRHYNITTFLCSQSWTSIPRRCRLQASNIFFFRGSASEAEKMCEEYSPPGFSKKRMLKLIDYATKDKFSFLHINLKVPHEERYRKNLGEIIVLDSIPED
jgi:hypothetical protein